MRKIFISTIALLLLLSMGLAVCAVEISPAIDILRSKTTFTKCALNGTDTSFSKDDFVSVAGCDFDYITVTKIPSQSDGVLKLSGVEVIDGQCITADSLDLLKFVPTQNTFETPPTFTFIISNDSWKSTEITCNISYLSSANYSPIANSFTINTTKNISVYSEITVYDPDDDEVTIKINAYPSFGKVSVNNGLKRITYTPEKNFTGSDVFTISAIDEYGNQSNEATVYVNVVNDSNSMTFGDMAESEIHFAALDLSKNNIMTYSMKGGEYYFSPKEEVNKIDFTVMLLCAAELNDGVGKVKDTEFIDDSLLSSGRKSYLKRALDTEIIEIGDGYFNPTETITAEEAKDMVSKALGLEKNSKELELIMGSSANETTLTKESVAEILYNICTYLK